MWQGAQRVRKISLCVYLLISLHLRLCSFRIGRQEDAHEYLVALLDAMHEAALAGYKPKPPKEVAETSLIYRIFAGQSRSQARLIPLVLEGFFHKLKI